MRNTPVDMLVGIPLAIAAIAWLVNLGPGPAHHRARPRARRSPLSLVRR